MTKDTIFLLLSMDFLRRYRIYEYVEKDDTKKWYCLGNFGHQNYMVFFPSVIKPIENGKFFFSPERTIDPTRSPCTSQRCINQECFNPIEVWEKNKTLNRSSLELPILFRNNTKTLWILKV